MPKLDVASLTDMVLCNLYFSSPVLFTENHTYFNLIYSGCLRLVCNGRTSSQGAQVHMNCIENSDNVCITLSVPSVHQTAESKLCLQHHALCDKDRDHSISLSGSTRCQWVTSLILHRPYLKNSRITCEGQIYCLRFYYVFIMYLLFMLLGPSHDEVRK